MNSSLSKAHKMLSMLNWGWTRHLVMAIMLIWSGPLVPMGENSVWSEGVNRNGTGRLASRAPEQKQRRTVWSISLYNTFRYVANLFCWSQTWRMSALDSHSYELSVAFLDQVLSDGTNTRQDHTKQAVSLSVRKRKQKIITTYVLIAYKRSWTKNEKEGKTTFNLWQTIYMKLRCLGDGK